MRALALLLLAGCDAVFGLSGHPGEVVDAPDAPVDGLVLDVAPACMKPAVMLPVIEDAEMIQSQPSQGHGNESLLNVGTAVGSIGLFKFDARLLEPSEIHQLHLHLPAVASAKECGTATACGSCLLIDHAGKLHAQLVRSDWDEAAASWSQRKTGVAWDAAGAQGPAERSPATAVSAYTGVGDAVISVDATQLADWVTTGSNPVVSVVVSPTDGAVIIVRQHQTWTETTCTPTPLAATLIADPCP